MCSQLQTFEDKTSLECAIEQNKLHFLDKVIRDFHFKVPFQNVGLLSKPTGIPSLQDIRSDCLKCLGGLCYTNNVFFCHLLKAFGFSAHHVAGTCNLKHPNNHIATVVCDVLQHDDKYLVDVGCGYQTLQAIPLDFVSESPIYKDSFLQYKFIRTGPNDYERIHLQNFGSDRLKSLSSASYSGKWERYYSFFDVPRDLEYFNLAMGEVYNDRFLRKFRVLRFSESGLLAIKEFGDKFTKLELTINGEPSEKVMTLEDVAQEAQNMLPPYNKETIQEAQMSWKRLSAVFT